MDNAKNIRIQKNYNDKQCLNFELTFISNVIENRFLSSNGLIDILKIIHESAYLKNICYEISNEECIFDKLLQNFELNSNYYIEKTIDNIHYLVKNNFHIDNYNLNEFRYYVFNVNENILISRYDLIKDIFRYLSSPFITIENLKYREKKNCALELVMNTNLNVSIDDIWNIINGVLRAWKVNNQYIYINPVHIITKVNDGLNNIEIIECQLLKNKNNQLIINFDYSSFNNFFGKDIYNDIKNSLERKYPYNLIYPIKSI